MGLRRGNAAPLVDIRVLSSDEGLDDAEDGGFIELPGMQAAGEASAEPHFAFRLQPMHRLRPLGSPRRPAHSSGLSASEVKFRLFGSKKKKRPSSPPAAEPLDCVSELAIISVSDIRAQPNLLLGPQRPHGGAGGTDTPWRSKYFQQSKLVNVMRDCGGTSDSFVLSRRNSTREPITMLRLVFDDAPIEPGDEADATVVVTPGWHRLRTPLVPCGAGGGAAGWLEYRRDLGATPIADIDFVDLGAGQPPDGFTPITPSISDAVQAAAGDKPRRSAFRDLRLAVQLGDTAPAEFRPVDAVSDGTSTAQVLEEGMLRVGPSDTVSQTIIAHLDQPILSDIRPEVSVTLYRHAGPEAFVLGSKLTTDNSLTLTIERTDAPKGWDTDVHVTWQVYGIPPPPTSGRADRGRRGAVGAVENGANRLEAAARQGGDAAPDLSVAIDAMNSRDTWLSDLSFEVDGWAPINHVGVSFVGQRTFVLRAGWRPAAAQLLVAVTLRDDLRTVTLSSPVVVVNRLEHEVQVCYQRTMHDETVVGTVPVGERLALPIGAVDVESDAQESFVPLFRFWCTDEGEGPCCPRSYQVARSPLAPRSGVFRNSHARPCRAERPHVARRRCRRVRVHQARAGDCGALGA